jgi:hypothetical protein
MPTPTDLVTDLPADFEVFGQAVATSLADLLGGTSGQILAKNSNTDMDFVWIANDQGDITGITASSPLTGGGTSGAVTLGILSGTTSNLGAVQLSDSTSSTSTTLAATANAVKTTYDLANGAIPKSLIDAAGDLIVGTAADTAGRIAIGTNGQVLTSNGTTATWATPSSGSFAGCRAVNNANQSINNTTATAIAFQTETFDSDAFHDNSTNNSRLTIPAGKTGYYQISALVRWQNDATTNTVRQLRPYKNGVQQNVYTIPWVQNDDAYQVYTDLMSLSAGDYIELYVWHNDGAATSLLSDSSFSLVKVG